MTEFFTIVMAVICGISIFNLVTLFLTHVDVNIEAINIRKLLVQLAIPFILFSVLDILVLRTGITQLVVDIIYDIAQNILKLGEGMI